MMGFLTTRCFILVLVAVSHGYEHCYIDNSGFATLCEYGCCGSGINKYCCTNTNYLPTQAIVGIAVGVGFFLNISCIVCCVCFCNNASRRPRGQVVGSNYPMSVVVAGDAGTTFPWPPYPVQTGAYYQQPTALPTTYP